ncbi:hypothetical protein KJ841_02130 [Patescibacteria group bacterium]|nr:hypothetical protein [Patescibacteria group bacterium]
MTDKKEEKRYMCSACIDGDRTKGLMCSGCYNDHRKLAKNAIDTHQPIESKLDFAIRKTRENLTSYDRQLDLLTEQTQPYFDVAYRDVKDEYRQAGIGPSRDSGNNGDFMNSVNIRCKELLENAGLEKAGEKRKEVVKILRDLESQMDWLEKIKANSQSEKVVSERTTKHVKREKVVV